MKTVPVLLGILVGLGTGYVVGRHASPDATRPAKSATESTNVATGPGASADALTAEAKSAVAAKAAPSLSLAERVRGLVALTPLTRQMNEANKLFAELAVAELPTVLGQLKALPPGRTRTILMGQLFARWGELDGPGALAVAQGLPARERWQAEYQTFEGWAKTNPRAAWEAARAEIAETPMAGFRGMAPLRELSRTNLVEAMNEAGKMRSQSTRYAARDAILQAAVEDGTIETVLQQALQTPSADEREEWVQAVFRRWGSLDSDAPMNALRSISDPDLARTAMNGFVAGWAELDPRGAVEFALEHTSDPMFSQALATTLGHSMQFLGEADLREIINEAKQTGTVQALSRSANMLAMNQPRLALELVAEVKDEKERTQQTNSILSMWSHNDFAAAAEFYEGMPATDAKLDAFRSISWSALQHADGAATVARWMEGFNGTDRVKAAEGLLQGLERRPGVPARPLKPTEIATLAGAIAATPGLPAPVQQRARALIPGAATP